MAVPLNNAQTTSSAVASLTPEEEDHIILARITNDERPLRRVLKKFHNYTSSAYTPVIPHGDVSASKLETLIDEAREAFLVELATFQLALKKSAMICEAEARQVEEYKRERRRIEDEHGTLREQIEQLKTALEEAQIVRRRKIEYDLVAEKINTLPSREELEHTIRDLENDMAAIRSEHETQDKIIHGQKAALDAIIAELGSLRFIGKDKDLASVAPSAHTTPAPEELRVEAAEIDLDENPTVTPEAADAKDPADDLKPDPEPPSSAPAAATPAVEDDIEMGEVEEDSPRNGKGKKKLREELEEGEASDTSSALSDPPDDI